MCSLSKTHPHPMIPFPAKWNRFLLPVTNPLNPNVYIKRKYAYLNRNFRRSFMHRQCSVSQMCFSIYNQKRLRVSGCCEGIATTVLSVQSENSLLRFLLKHDKLCNVQWDVCTSASSARFLDVLRDQYKRWCWDCANKLSTTLTVFLFFLISLLKVWENEPDWFEPFIFC